MKYKITLYKSEEGYNVSCPGLPGCWSQGETEDEAIENIQDAIKEYLGITAKSSFMRRRNGDKGQLSVWNCEHLTLDEQS